MQPPIHNDLSLSLYFLQLHSRQTHAVRSHNARFVCSHVSKLWLEPQSRTSCWGAAYQCVRMRGMSIDWVVSIFHQPPNAIHLFLKQCEIRCPHLAMQNKTTSLSAQQNDSSLSSCSQTGAVLSTCEEQLNQQNSQGQPSLHPEVEIKKQPNGENRNEHLRPQLLEKSQWTGVGERGVEGVRFSFFM